MASENRSPSKAGDVDIYAKNEGAFNKLSKLFKDKGLSIKHENEMAITYVKISDPKHEFYSCEVIQLIKPVVKGKVVAMGSMEEVLKNFDFTVIRCGLIDEDSVMVDADFENDEQKNILRLKNIHCPISSTMRCMKYSKKGYWLPPMQALRLFLDWEQRDDEYREQLVDFLTKANEGEGLTQKEIDEMEALMRID